MSHSVRLLASVGAISLLLAACEPPTWPQFGRTPPPPAADADGEELGVPTDQEVYAGIVEDYRKDNSPEAEAQILARAEDLSRSGYTPASILAGNLYSQGYGYSGDIDHRKAFEHYLIAGRAGDSNAYLGLALSAKRLDDHGGYQPSEVLEILEKSVREMPSTAGHINLGRFYAEGFGRRAMFRPRRPSIARLQRWAHPAPKPRSADSIPIRPNRNSTPSGRCSISRRRPSRATRTRPSTSRTCSRAA
ncbi:MAG: hypothetical protein ACMVY4_10215 [Minwuia sp.]|uniref:hypothetical protein n=1 Tax=Minwuia sp. TaxID=2493630 RepID=UPI003A85732D